MRERLDKVLVTKGLASSRTKAAEMIERYGVRVQSEGHEWLVFDKSWSPPQGIGELSYTLLSQDLNLYVSRGALKLAAAMEHTGLELKGKMIVDVGQSTGGFTDVCLSRGAQRVLGIEVGFDQLHPKLRQDPRVTCWERTSVFEIKRNHLTSVLGELIDLVVADVSQVEISDLVPHVLSWRPESMLLLLKPQYQKKLQRDYTRGRINFSDPHLLEKCRELAQQTLQDSGWSLLDFFPSSICGAEGSQEYWIYIKQEKGRTSLLHQK